MNAKRQINSIKINDQKLINLNKNAWINIPPIGKGMPRKFEISGSNDRLKLKSDKYFING